MKKTICLSLVIILGAAGLWAQEETRLTLEDCLARALAGNRALRAQAYVREAAWAAVGEMYSLYLPSLSVSAGYGRTNPQETFSIAMPVGPPLVLSPSIEDNFLLRFELRHNLFTGFKIKSSIGQAAALAAAGDAAYEAGRADTVWAASEAFLALAQGLEADAITAESLATVKARVNEVKKLLAQGLATNNDVLKAELEQSQAEMQAIDGRNAVRLARARLNFLIGLPLETPVRPEISAAASGSLPVTVDASVAEAMARRPELTRAREEVRALEAALDYAASGFYPAVILKGNYTFANPNPAVFPREAEWNGTWEVGAAVSIDLGAYPQTIFKLEQASKKLEAARTRLEEAREVVSLEVLQAYLELAHHAERLITAGKILAQAEENMRVVTEKNRNGLAVLSDVLDAKISWLKARLIRSQAGYESELARLRFLHAQGLLQGQPWTKATP